MGNANLQDKVLNYIRENRLTEPGQKVLLAVSGGPDSMALLFLLARCREKLGVELAVAHLDHGLRPTSAAEAELVKDVCDSLGVPAYLKREEVRERASEMGLGIEAAARVVRHDWLRNVREQIDADRIATAHHRDDQVETILLHLIRGTGLKGLAGMSAGGPLYIRPLFCAGKEEILEFMQEEGLPYCVDESNTDINYLRNRVRHRLLPVLERDFNPRIRERIFALGEIAALENDFMDEETMKWWLKVARSSPGESLRVDTGPLDGLHPALVSRLIIKAITVVRGCEDFTSLEVARILELLDSEGSSHYVELAGGISVRKEYRELVFTRIYERHGMLEERRLIWPGRLLVPEFDIWVEAGDSVPESGAVSCKLNRSALPPVLVVRTRRPGDRIRLDAGSRKLSDWFIDRKVPSWQRDQVLLLAAPEGQVIWIAGGPVGKDYRWHEGEEPLYVTVKGTLPAAVSGWA